MAGIHQLQLSFAPEEDRLLLRVSTDNRAEFRMWMTRRYVRLLWPVLVKLLESDPQVSLQPERPSREAVISFQHQSALATSDFSTPYRDDALTRPLGEAPLLLSRIQVKRNQDSQPVLCMHPASGQGLELAMNHQLLHSFCRLLADTARAADWSLDLALGTVRDPSEQPPERVN